MFDGIDINAPQATVQIENVRITDLWGTDSMMHADAVQTWGGVKDLRIDHMSVDGDYQGLTIDPDLGPVGAAEIENVDLTIDPIPAVLAPETEGGGHVIWLTRGATSCDAPSSVTFQNVYIDASQSDDETGGGTVWPSAVNTTLPCAAVLQGDEITWPSLPVTGSVALGMPPAGSFVPAGLAGSGYVSPWTETTDGTSVSFAEGGSTSGTAVGTSGAVGSTSGAVGSTSGAVGSTSGAGDSSGSAVTSTKSSASSDSHSTESAPARAGSGPAATARSTPNTAPRNVRLDGFRIVDLAGSRTGLRLQVAASRRTLMHVVLLSPGGSAIERWRITVSTGVSRRTLRLGLKAGRAAAHASLRLRTTPVGGTAVFILRLSPSSA
jgi:hypothetical protein